MGGARPALGAVAVLALTLALAVPAEAASPLKIREVFPGTPGQPGAEYVELQMTAGGQGDVDGQELRFYEADGDPIAAAGYSLTEGDEAGLVAETQRTLLLATPAAGGLLGGDAATPDVVLPAADRMDPAGGAVCFTLPGGGAPADCVSWGAFPPQPPPFQPQLLPDLHSSNAAAFPGSNAAGQALERDISRGCPTYLESLDDTGGNAVDFALQGPSPRDNGTAPGELRCPPAAAIFSGPTAPFENPTSSDAAAFEYGALTDETGLEFQCHLAADGSQLPGEAPPGGGEWQACAGPPQTYVGLGDGFYRFWVRAKGENPEWGPPANRGWEVDTTPPQTSIGSTPPDPSDGFEASFSFGSSEPLSSFRCQLDEGAVQVCGTNASSSSKSYFALGDGRHVFRVWATDNAGNQDPSPAAHSFTVQTSLADSTPPDTSILTAPSNPSPSSEAFFAYGSSEPGSRFECSLDGGGFAGCDAAGVSYGSLPNGSHRFEVRAIDGAGNVDSLPAVHVWRVAAPVPNTRIVGAPGGAIRSKRGRPVRVTFRFRADKPGSTYRCRLDLKGRYRPCSSPHRVRVEPGRHVFEVFAVDALGNEEGSPAFRIFRVRAPGEQRSFFVQQGRFLSSLSAGIAPSRLPRSGLRPVSLSFGSTFENLDGSDIPGLKTMTLKLARGGVLNARGLPRCTRGRLAQRSTAKALAACRRSLVGKGTVSTALRFPEGLRSRSSARLLLFNAGNRLLMHVYTRDPVEGTFIVSLKISRLSKGRFGTVLRARFPRIAAGFGQVTGFQMTLKRTFRHRGKRRSYLLGGCPAPRGLNRVSFELARVDYRFRDGLRIRNSTINSCRAIG